MSIKPVDFQISIPRTVEMSKVRGDENTKELAQQQAQAGSIQHKADNSMKQVQKRNQAEEAKIREKQEKEGSKQKNKGQENKDEDNSQQNEGKYVAKQKTSTFDVKI